MKKNQQGFSLMELLIVIAIVGILAAVLIPNILSARSQANNGATRIYIRLVVTGVETRRDYASASLPPSSLTCMELAGKDPEPGSVNRCKYEPSTTEETYTVTAESVSGEVFQYNGAKIIAVATY